jgi:hypothetical protein
VFERPPHHSKKGVNAHQDHLLGITCKTAWLMVASDKGSHGARRPFQQPADGRQGKVVEGDEYLLPEPWR